MINKIYHEKLPRQTEPHAMPVAVHLALLEIATRPSIAYRGPCIIVLSMIVAAFDIAQGDQNLSVAKIMTTQLHSQSKALHHSRTIFFCFS